LEVIPARKPSPVQDVLLEAHDRVLALCGHDIAMALATLDGPVYCVGPPALQAVTQTAWPFLYALALDGRDDVLAGLSAFAGRGLPAGLTRTATSAAGAEVQDERTIEDVVSTLSELGALDQVACSALVEMRRRPGPRLTAADLAVGAATLAGGGINPRTGDRVVSAASARGAVAAMAACGLGRSHPAWQLRAGLPAVAGDDGMFMSTVPGQAGTGLVLPALQPSAIGAAEVEDLLEQAGHALTSTLGLSAWQDAGAVNGRQGRSYAWDAGRSPRRRTAAERELLAARGAGIIVHEVPGDQSFHSAQAVTRRVLDGLDGVGWVVLDARRCGRVSDAALTMLRRLMAVLSEQEVQVAIVDPLSRPDLAALADAAPGAVAVDTALDGALEQCELSALAKHGHVVHLPDGLVPLGEQDVLRELTPGQLAVVQSVLSTRVLTAGTIVYHEGDPADGLYLVGAGLLEVDVPNPGGRRRFRSSAIGAGQAFGERALLGEDRRAERVSVLEATLCHLLPRQAFERLRAESPAIAVAILAAVARSLSEHLARATTIVGTLQT
jgi:glutaminase